MRDHATEARRSGAKHFVKAADYLRDSFQLARQVLDSGWQPQLLIALWRGGAPVGVALHEFLHYHGWRMSHHALKSRLYRGIAERASEARLTLCPELQAELSQVGRVLVVDDILDSGTTARAVLQLLAGYGVEARLAVVYWRQGCAQVVEPPHYHVHRSCEWVVFPHELEGLTPAEINAKDAGLAELCAREN